MKKYKFLLLLLLYPFISNGQMKLYKTYEDYINKKYTEYKDFKNKISPVVADLRLILRDKDNKIVEIRSRECWGFEYKNVLFRYCDTSGNMYLNCMPVRVVSIGKIIYYENGIGHLDALVRNKTYGTFTTGGYFYFSKSLNSKIYDNSRDTFYNKLSYQQLLVEDIEYNELFACLIKDIDPKFKTEKYLHDYGRIDNIKKFSYSIVESDIGKYISKLNVNIVRECMKIFNSDNSITNTEIKKYIKF